MELHRDRRLSTTRVRDQSISPARVGELLLASDAYRRVRSSAASLSAIHPSSDDAETRIRKTKVDAEFLMHEYELPQSHREQQKRVR